MTTAISPSTSPSLPFSSADLAPLQDLLASIKNAPLSQKVLGSDEGPSASTMSMLADFLLSCLGAEDPADIEMLTLAVASSGLDKKLASMRATDAAKLKVEIAQLKAFADAARALEKAEKLKNNPFLKAFKWIAIIITAIIAALLVVATGGAATAVAATMMLGICALTVMSEISNEVAASKGDSQGVIPSFDAICGKLCGAIARASGASEEEAKKAEMYGGMALSIFIQVGLSAGAMGASVASSAAQITGKMAQAGSTGFSSVSRSAIRESGKLFEKIDIDVFKKLGSGLVKFADESSDVELLAKTLQRSFTYLTYASLVSQMGDGIGNIMTGVADKEVGDTAAEVVTQEGLMKWLIQQMEVSEEEAKELMAQLERSANSINAMVKGKSDLIEQALAPGAA